MWREVVGVGGVDISMVEGGRVGRGGARGSVGVVRGQG